MASKDSEGASEGLGGSIDPAKYFDGQTGGEFQIFTIFKLSLVQFDPPNKNFQRPSQPHYQIILLATTQTHASCGLCEGVYRENFCLSMRIAQQITSEENYSSSRLLGCAILSKVLDEISPRPNPIPIPMNVSPSEKKSNFLHV